MADSYNPFDEIFSRLEKLEKLLTDLSDNQFPIQRNKEPDQWFDLNGLIAYLPSHPKAQTIYEWVHKKIIPFYKSPETKMLSFLKSEIDLWLKSGRRKTQHEKTTLVNNFLNKKHKL
jgi:hypothetical protein